MKKTQKQVEKIKFQLTTTNVHTRWPCHICGGHTEKGSILCECEVVKEPHKRLLRICEFCLQAGKGKVNARLQSHIAQLEEEAAYLRSLTDRLEFPTYAAWKKAVAKEERLLMKANP